jgi:hypothetical protein
MPEEKATEKTEKETPWWKDKTFKIALAICLIGTFLAFVLPRIWPEKPPLPEREVADLRYESEGLPLSNLIGHVEGETHYDVITTKEVRKFKVDGVFQGRDWIDILRKVANAYDDQLKVEIDEKTAKIRITLKTTPKKK